MSWFVSDELVPVEIGTCRCPGTPHSTDTVWLLSELTTEGGWAAVEAINSTAHSSAERNDRLRNAYIRHQIARWTLVDENGEPVPFDTPLGWEAAYPIGEKAAELYGDQLTRPLVARASMSSPNGHTGPPIRARKRSSTARPKR